MAVVSFHWLDVQRKLFKDRWLEDPKTDILKSCAKRSHPHPFREGHVEFECFLRDDADHAFTFPTFTLSPGATVQVWTKSGSNTATDLYWGSGSAIWNNSGDCAYLRDSGGTAVDTYCY